MTILDQLEHQLRTSGKFWQYVTRIEGKELSHDAQVEIAHIVLAAPKSWAQGLAEEFAGRKYPPGYDAE